MNFVLQPWQLLVVVLTGWLNRQQQAVIDFLLAEAQVLKETHGKRQIRLSDDQRRRLAIKGKFLAHYHGERNHQGRENRIIEPGAEVGQLQGNIRCRDRLGGILRYYYREAA